MGWKSGEGGCFGSDALVLLVANQTNARAEEGKTFMVVILYGKSWPGFRRSGRYPFPRECGKVLRQQCANALCGLEYMGQEIWLLMVLGKFC